MIIHLTKDLITMDDIEKRAKRLSVSDLILPLSYSAGSQQKSDLSEEEGKLLDTVIQMIGHSFASLHINYHLSNVNMPLASLYIHTTHIFALFFQKEGVRIAELLSPGDVLSVLTQCIVTMPSGEEQTPYYIEEKTIEDAVEAIIEGKVENTEEIASSLKNQPCISFWMTGVVGEFHGMILDAGSESCNLIEENEKVKLTLGSPSHGVIDVNEHFLRAFQMSVKSFNKQ